MVGSVIDFDDGLHVWAAALAHGRGVCFNADVSFDPDLPPPIPDFLPAEVLAADAVAAQATDPHAPAHGHHGPFRTHCENCGAKLEGPWCHACGQHDFEFHRSFRHVFMEALESFFHFDGAFFRCTFTLLFKPGRLTELFNAGKRASQMPPFRLYVFVAFVFFLIMHFAEAPEAAQGEGDTAELDGGMLATGTGPVQFDSETQRLIWKELTKEFAPSDWDDREKIAARFSTMGEKADLVDEKLAAATPPGGTLTPEETRQIVLDTLAADNEARAQKADTASVEGPSSSTSTATLGDDEEVPEWLTRLAARISDEEQRRHLVEKFFASVPKILLLCLPIFVLLTRGLFFRDREFVYLKHLVLALHFHTFIYLWTLVLMGAGWIAGLPGWGLQDWLTFAGVIWALVYPVLMLRRLFRNGWMLTLFKTGVLGLAHSFVLGTAFTTAALWIFAL